MNSITLNGVNSNTISGLLIQSLPPISKPLMRAQVEEIDGRAGDIITKLGFAAYDKYVSIGLYGNYNVDEVIKFFNSEGTVTFSNEPDKYYKYTILSQIDFERLLRYKTATVAFHCQPYKYSTTETPITVNVGDGEENLIINVTNSGNTAAKPQLTIYGSGNLTVELNGIDIFNIALGDYGNITLDADVMNAYTGNILMNRLVTGSYDNLSLPIGQNTIKIKESENSEIIEATIANYSLWI